LWFCDKEVFEEDKIENDLQTILLSDRILQNQYCAKNCQNYSDLIHDILQAKKYDELTIRNHRQRFIGSAPLSKVHYSAKGKEKVDRSNNYQKNFDKFKKGKWNKQKKSKFKGQSWGKGKQFHKAIKWHKYSCSNHIVKKWCTPQHLVDLYEKSLKDFTLNEHMNPTLMTNLKRLLFREPLRWRPKCQAWQSIIT
jgi:hypothetical protein